MTIYTRPDPSVPVWAESGDKVQPTNGEIQTGWPLSNTPPSRQRFNWVEGFNAEAARYLLQRGIAEWVAGEDYPLHARVQYNGTTFRALMNSPTSAPGAVAGEWSPWGSALEASASGRFSATTILTPAAAGRMNEFTGASYNVTLPALSSLRDGQIVPIVYNGSGTLTVQRQGADQISVGGSSLTSMPVLSGETLALVAFPSAGLFFVLWGTAALQYSGAFDRLLEPTGRQRLPGGLIMQWGQVTANNSTPVPVTFPIAFPTAAFRMFLGVHSTGGAAWARYGPLNLTGTTIAQTTNFSTQGCEWLVFGK